MTETKYGTLPFIKMPTTIPELVDYIKKSLGHPIIKIEVTDEQFYLRIMNTLLLYRDYHYNGSLRSYVKWQVTQEDIDNQYLTVDPNIIGITRVFDPQNSSSSMFTSIEFWMRSQMNFSDFYGTTQVSYIGYFLTQQRIADLDQIFRSNPGITYNFNDGKLHINIDWGNDVIVGSWIMAECHTFLDPNTCGNIFHERFVLDHATAGVQEQWGLNLGMKFGNIPLPGGLTIQAEKIYLEGKEKREALEKDLISNQMPPLPQIE